MKEYARNYLSIITIAFLGLTLGVGVGYVSAATWSGPPGNPATPNADPPIGVPFGGIVMFDLTSCPSGWSEYTQMRGRYLVGAVEGEGSANIGRAVGSTLTSGENRPAGSHTHSFSAIWNGSHSDAGYQIGAINGGGSFGKTTNSGNDLVGGTPAPYMEFLACKKL